MIIIVFYLFYGVTYTQFLVKGRGLAYEQQKTCNLIGF